MSIGQQLKIPETPPTNINPEYLEYVVKSGDSLWSIANRYNTSVNEIRELNELSSDVLQIGQVLLIPISENVNNITYTVKAGDSLYSIAQKYGTTVDEIKKANNLTSNLLSIGQQLKIPTTKDYLDYTVQSGDSLYKIAQKFNTTVNDIINLNNLTTSLLQIGQQLKIPISI